MFIEFQTKDDKSIFYNVHNVVFIGEMDEQVSVLFDDGTHAIVPDEYAEVVKKVIELIFDDIKGEPLEDDED